MSMVSLRLSESLHEAARQLAEKEEISLNQLIATALAEKLSALSAEEIIRERAKRGDRSKFLAALDRSPDAPDPFEAESENPTVESTLAKQTATVQRFCRKLMKDIVIAGVESYSTASQNGDLRFRVTNGVFAEINFRRRTDEIILRLYFPPDEVLDERYKPFGEQTSKQAKYERRLNAADEIPDDVMRNIRRARDFMLNKRN
jgi:hypothetical protein